MLRLAPTRLTAHSLTARAHVRHSSSLWRKEYLYKNADGRYRIHRLSNKPTMPVRLEAVLGVKNKAFKHGVLLPDGHVIPWYGKPGHELISFWRQKVAEWRAMLELRRECGLPEVFSCPRCHGALSRRPRAKGFDELFAEDIYFCQTASCAIAAAKVRKTKTVAIVHILKGIVEDRIWRRQKRRADILAGIPVPTPRAPRKRVSKVVGLPALQRPEMEAVAKAMQRMREARAAGKEGHGGGPRALATASREGGASR